MPRPHAKHHNGLYPTCSKLPNIFRGQVNVWKQPRDLGGIQDLILSWKQAASNINLIQYKRSTLEKNKWWQMWRYALVETRRLGSRTKSIRRQNKNVNKQHILQDAAGSSAQHGRSLTPSNLANLTYMPPNPPNPIELPFVLPGVWVEEQEGSISSSNEEINRCMIQDLKHTTGHGIKE